MKRITALSAVIALVAGFAGATIEETWLNSLADNNFTNGANWSAGTGPIDFPTTETWIGRIDVAGANYCEFNSPGVTTFVRQLKMGVGTGVTGEFRLTDGIINNQKNKNGTEQWSEMRVGLLGTGTYIQSGGTNYQNWIHCPMENNANGSFYVSGGLLEARSGGGAYDSSLVIGGHAGKVGQTGLFEISGGTVSNFIRGVQLGNDQGSIGTFHLVGSGPDKIVMGDNNHASNGYGAWQQFSNSVLKVGVDSGGVTPVQLVISDPSQAGNNHVTFETGALLEPYFTGVPQTNKWTVIEADDFTDKGIAFSTNVTDPKWSFTITNSTLEVWYGLGDSGYESPYVPPSIIYTNATCYWDGEAGDNSFDNPTNWAFAGNNVLPAEGVTTPLEFVDNGTNYCIYTQTEGSRTYGEINVGRATTGRLDLIGNGYTLKADQNNRSNYIGVSGGSGTVNILGGATYYLSASPGRIGRDGGSTGVLNVVNGRVIYGRVDASTISLEVGADGGYGEVNIGPGARFRTRGGVELAHNTGTGLFSVKGLFAEVKIGDESSLDGKWVQNDGGTLEALITSNGLSTIIIRDKDAGVSGVDGNAYFYGGELNVEFDGWDGSDGSWDLMTWEGSLIESNLSFAAGVDTNIWSFAFVDTDTNSTPDTLRITADNLLTYPTVVPNITSFSISGSTASLTWDSEEFVGYNVLSKNDLNASWTTNAGGITGAGSSTSTNLTTSGLEEFYTIEAYAQ